MNACIISIFMNNIDMKTVEYQQKVVAKFNPRGYQHYSVLTGLQPGYTMDKLVEMSRNKGHDVIMFLDVDCIPLEGDVLEYMFNVAEQGELIGDAQRSNHIENDQHIFIAPHNITFTMETYDKIGRPSFNPTYRGDVAEELTFRAEELGIKTNIILPMKYDAPPIRMEWEPVSEPYWKLAEGMPVYGIGTTFGIDDDEMFWHNYQIFHPGQQERFQSKCKDILGE